MLEIIRTMRARTLNPMRRILALGKNPTSPAGKPKIRIKNFGQMDHRFYRGGQPKVTQFRELTALGIKTVIDLRDDALRNEQFEVQSLGMHYVSIPMSDTKYPQSEQIDAFLNLVRSPLTGKFFVHCSGGRHRTGVIGAVYRLTVNQWNYDQVYSEMKSYDFYTRWGHGPLKQFVQEYWRVTSQVPKPLSEDL